ncbi:MAG: GPR1/FUN34/YaaH family transporter [Pseudonocardia sp.]
MSVESDVQTTAAAAPVANPALMGLPTFLPGALSLALWLVGYLPAADLGGIVPAVVASSGLFLLIAAIWSSRAGNSAVAGIFGTFSAFWLSLGFLVAALTNGWFGLDATTSQALGTFLIVWLIVFAALTLATLRLPLAFTAGFAFVVLAVLFVLLSVLTGTAVFQLVGGICVFIFCAIFTYIYFDAFGQELGGRAMPLGSAMVK